MPDSEKLEVFFLGFFLVWGATGLIIAFIFIHIPFHLPSMMTTTVIFQQHPKQGNLKKEGKSVKRITEDKTKAREVRKKTKNTSPKVNS